jgi:predicted adenylyl cyclase CyaB
MKNIEIKYWIPNTQKLIDFLNDLPEVKYIWEKEQTDTYFNVNLGKLKLRQFSNDQAELIYYERADAEEPRESNYFICPTENPQALLEILTKACGFHLKIHKIRRLFMFRNVRIHLDEVRKLGCFLELESVVNSETDQLQAQQNLTKFQEYLTPLELIPEPLGYADLQAGKLNHMNESYDKR